MPPLDDIWGRVSVLGPDGVVLGTCVLRGRGHPDLKAVDDVAHLQLLATRLGGAIVLDAASPALRELLELAGLAVEVRGQAEHGEDLRCVQEHVEPGDTAP